MNSDFYKLYFSSNGFGHGAIALDRALIFVLDTNSRNAASLLEAELSKSYMKSCCLLIFQGVNACDFEDIADDCLLEWEDAFVPTATSSDVTETLALIGGWEIKKPKNILVVTDSDTLPDELKSHIA